MKALLAKIVDIRYTGYLSSVILITNDIDNTYDTPREFCKFGTRLGAVEHHSYAVPRVVSQGVEREMGLNTYKLYSDLLIIQEVRTLKYDSKGTFTNLFADPVMNPNYIRGRRRHWCHEVRRGFRKTFALTSVVKSFALLHFGYGPLRTFRSCYLRN